MSLVSNLIGGMSAFRADVTGTPAPWDDYWYSPVGGGSSATGMRVSPDSAKRIAAVLACVSLIGRNIATMPVRVLTDLPGGGKRPVPEHPVYDLLTTRPNAQQTACDFFLMMQGHVELRGNAFAKIVPGPRGAVDQLLPMHPDRVQVDQIASGKLRYKYNDPRTGNTDTFMQEEVFHLRGASDDGILGQSTVGMAADTFGVALSEQEYAARFFQNDAQSGLVIEGTNFRDKEDERQFVSSWQQASTGANRHKTKLLPLGLSLKELGVKPADSQLLDSRKFSRIEICSIFGVPPHLIGETEKTATYASVEQFNIMFATQCLLPRIVMWEQTIQRDLILSPKYYPKFSMAALLRGDTASRYQAYQIAIQNGWMCQDDVRALEDLNPIADGSGKTYWRPLNWAPLAQIAQPVDSGTDAAPATITDDSGDDSSSSGTDAQLLNGRLKILKHEVM